MSWASSPTTHRCSASSPSPARFGLKIDEERRRAYDVSGGFLSVTEDGVTILAESCEPADSGTD